MIMLKTITGPICNKCQEHMAWVSEQIVGNIPIQVFHCETCDKYAAELAGTNGVKAEVAPGLVTGL
jgi:protein-arginine kinase activator protein McsA